MSIKAISIGLTLVFAAAGSAQAAGLNGGFYVGAEIGRDVVTYAIKFDDYVNDGTGANGNMAGIFAGYDHKMGPIHIGVEANLDTSDAKVQFGAKGDRYFEKKGRSYGLSARAGTEISNSAQIYVRAGWINTKHTITDAGVSLESNKLNGLKLGAGIETGVTEAMSVRAEYDFVNYKNDEIFHDELDQFKLGLSYYF